LRRLCTGLTVQPARRSSLVTTSSSRSPNPQPMFFPLFLTRQRREVVVARASAGNSSNSFAMAFSLVSGVLKYEIVAVAEVCGLFRAGLDEREHEVDGGGHIAGRTSVLRDGGTGIPNAHAALAEGIGIDRCRDDSAILIDGTASRGQARLEESPIRRTCLIQIGDGPSRPARSNVSRRDFRSVHRLRFADAVTTAASRRRSSIVSQDPRKRLWSGRRHRGPPAHVNEDECSGCAGSEIALRKSS
jgi:hypothetical protein